ncbi:hypothetical protein PNH50_08955 [Leisingera aquaemixtae]|uniref:hypothetical protein n=1 Tax=Leisingera aquaemixtae TaxID=1396826 RepID=UPI003983E20C
MTEVGNFSSYPAICGLDGVDLIAQSPEAFETFGALAPRVGGREFSGSSLSKHSARIERLAFAGMSESEIYVFLFRATATAREALDRSKRFLGRIYNWMTGPAEPYVTVPGHLLIRLFKETTGKFPGFLKSGHEYKLRLDYAEAFAELYKTAYEAQALQKR